MKITILTVAPEMFGDFLESHCIARAKKLGLLTVDVVDVRTFADGSFRAVDDSPFGGGRGLVMRAAPIRKALAELRAEGSVRAAALTPAGIPYDQKKARELAEEDHLVLVCGHYEGLDERIYRDIDDRICIGDYILSGGELAAMAVTDSVARLLPGNLKQGSADEESFEHTLLEYPQYTQPADLDGDLVPEVLLSGNHAKIAAYRKEEAIRLTKELRPDLYERYLKSGEERKEEK